MTYEDHLARTIDLANKTYPQFGLCYGSKTDLFQGIAKLYSDAREALIAAQGKIDPAAECVVLDWAGIGDTVHSRLIVQHLARDYRVSWITVPLVVPLYKDDKLCQVLTSFASPYRDARQTFIWQGLCDGMDFMFREMFDFPKLVNISTGVGRYWHKEWSRTSYPELFFAGAGVKRDWSVVHQLTHKGKSKKKLKRYIIIEHASITFGNLPVAQYEDLVQRLSKLGIASVVVGGPNDPAIKGAVDCRGLNLYDTFSVVKNSIGFVGRSSGNQSLMCFLPEIPLFEVGIPDLGAFGPCGYHDYSTRLTAANFVDEVVRFYAK